MNVSQIVPVSADPSCTLEVQPVMCLREMFYFLLLLFEETKYFKQKNNEK